MTEKEINEKYLERLENLYSLAITKKEPGTAMVILDKIRNLELYICRPAEDENDTSV